MNLQEILHALQMRAMNPEEAKQELAKNMKTSPVSFPIQYYAGELHPLLHQNTSDLSEQRYSSIFTGLEFFLADHIVKGRKVLPGVAHLEMARAAVEVAAGILTEDRRMVKLKNVIWARPIEVDQEPVQIHLVLYPEKNGEIAYEIYGMDEQSNAEAMVYSQGIAVLEEISKQPAIELKSIQAGCNQRKITRNEIYSRFKEIELDYGPGHQGLETIDIGRELALAKLALPSSVAGTEEQFVLHPSIMDAALQASIEMMGAGTSGGMATPKLSLPFALQELEIYSRCTGKMWAILRYRKDSFAADKILKLDIDLCDEQGQVCVRMIGLTIRELGAETSKPQIAATTIGKIILERSWEDQTVPNVNEAAKAPQYIQQLVILCEPGEIRADDIEAGIEGATCLLLQSKQKSIAKRYQTYAVQMFQAIQKILIHKPTGKILVQLVVANRETEQIFTGLSGILKTAQTENPKVNWQLIELDTMESPEELMIILKENRGQSKDTHIRYHQGKRQIASWRQVVIAPELAEIPWKDGGVYLITGGAGGLGMIFAHEIATKVKDAKLILAGRSRINNAKEAQLQGLESNGTKAEYRTVDVSNRQEVKDLIGSIEAAFGKLDGIIHSAGIIRDSYIIKKTKEEFTAVLNPKVTGLENLDIASKEMKLDFMILFSSTAGCLGNPGQADYATANAFMDTYAEYRNQMVNNGERQGRTLSINWPLWQEGGMRVDRTVEKMLRQTTGMTAMRTSSGIRALYEGMAAGKSQVMVLEGNPVQISAKFLGIPVIVHPEQVEEKSSVPSGYDSGSLREKILAVLTQMVSKLLKVKLEDIDTTSELSEYGFDSISLTEFGNILNEEYGLELTPTIFFEYPTLCSFSEYLTREHQETLADRFTVPLKVQTPEVVTIIKTNIFKRQPGISRFAGAMALPPKPEITPNDIAVVGMSGIFPQARNLEEFWNNLLTERDCISEIPKDRWDWKAYYGDPHKDADKTNIKWGGFIDGVAEFDPLFFGISPREAELMDPQQRLLMIYIWKAIEDAGYSATSISGTKTGIFVGTTGSGYEGLISRAQVPVEGYTSTGLVASVGPNRMSYYLDIHGPSEPIETACSSSLVAIHRAVNAIENGNCEMAIVGGINTILNPELHISFSKAGMLSEEGRCKTFSDKANGYVRGEGAGMLVLKKLADAEESGDHIYGIIRGTAENHGGRATSLTAPNPKAQAELIQTAYRKAGIDPRTVTYIEAHGTGTELGDPVEINGLKMAFKDLYQATGEAEVLSAHCGLGSVKTNIGHLELAAGVAGVIKVLLQLKHKTLVKSLHCETVNPYIQFQDSPFYIVQEKRAWERLRDEEGREIPRRAGVSSFGFGGVNAHVVIEEYIPGVGEEPLAEEISQNPAAILISAKTGERLKEQVEQLLVAIETQRLTDHDLINIAYTLQIGREAMEERLALLVGSIRELEEKLRCFLEGQDVIINLYRGQVKRNNETLAALAIDEDMAKTIEAWINKKKYIKLLDLWVKGLVFDWNRLYGETKPRRIGLPTYPFAKERYWVPETSTTWATPKGITNYIHPLLHQNTSNLSEQRYRTTFTGREFFLANHLVKGQRVLPGVVYLEMARAAIKEAAGNSMDQKGVKLKNVVWIQPMMVGDEPVQVHIGIYPDENGEIAFEIYNLAENQTSETIVYSQGSAALAEVVENPLVDLKTMQAECNQRSINAAEIYDFYKTTGIEYGPGHQAIETIYVGSEIVLAKISLPSSVADTEAQFVLHPSLMDAALQASIGMMNGTMDGMAAPKLSLPFTLQELEVYHRCTGKMWVVIRYRKESTAVDKIRKLDIDVCNEQGKVCVRLKGFSARVLEGGIGETKPISTIGNIMLEPVWKDLAIREVFNGTKFPEYSQQLVILCEPGENSAEIIETGLNGVRCLILQSKSKSIAQRYLAYAIQIFEAIRKILETKPTGQVLVQLVVGNRGEQQLYAGLSGILTTASMENPKVIGQVIEMETLEDPEGLIVKLKENSNQPFNRHLRYQEGKWQVAGWNEIRVAPEVVKIPWKDGGVYLITGGTGGLGMIFAKEIVTQVNDVTLILTGRSSLSEAKQIQLKELERSGSRIQYRLNDISDQKAVQELIGSIKAEFGKLDGIIHNAGVIRDNYLIKKTNQEFTEVLNPKVTGLDNLDIASKEMNLDFMILSSSTAGCLGNPGQADYATANAFMDTYADYRNRMVNNGERRGRTLSINWPLWQEGGMRVDQVIEKNLQQTIGMNAMRTASGIRALYEGIAAGKPRVMVLEGNLARIREKFLGIPVISKLEKPEATSSIPSGYDNGILREKLLTILTQGVSKLLKVEKEKIDADTELSEFGFDSISLTEFSNTLNQEYGLELAPTIFFEYPTLRSFSGYLAKEHRKVLAGRFMEQPKLETPAAEIKSITPDSSFKLQSRRSRFTGTMTQPIKPETGANAIAVVGMSGIFPQSRDVEEFWDNLLLEKDCITEIPKDRWDWEAYYGDPQKEANKTEIKWGGFIDGVAEFDPLFFGISPREAELMDPQQRLLMTYVWKAIEDAGYSAESLSGTRTGIFIGTANTGYDEIITRSNVPIEGFTSTGLVASVGPNRMSYYLNIHGPSEPIETACSSSLVAIHRAVIAIENGNCEMAIVGGINTILTPVSHISFNKAGMLSKDGRCKTFSDRADGYARGEGVGILCLKKLNDAEAAGDHIYGIIRGTAENHGGRANSLTAPNPKAQAELLQTAYQKAGIDPRTVTYIETHGTGTELGDPIEINGLKMAFRELCQATGDTAEISSHCGLGSVKTNIGHLELAAGVAGVIKVLLQLKHETLVKTLHCDTINPYIQLNDSPFYIVREKRKWEPLQDAQGRQIPRRAGVSSFGFGGVNAHVIVEEYIPRDQERSSIKVTPQNPAIIVLAAKNEEQLKKQAEQLAVAIETQRYNDADLADLAYTLQVGREALEERLAMLVGSIQELEDKLKNYLAGREDISDFYRGQLKRNKETLTVLSVDEDMAKIIEAWITKRKYTKLMDLWVKGLAFDWDRIYHETKPRRLSLPTYPFARDRYWVTDPSIKFGTSAKEKTYLHPLLQQNTSDLSEQRYSSTFRGDEFFLADHVIGGQKVLPGVAYLEMARAAVEAASGIRTVERQGFKLRNVVWARPIGVNEEPVEIHIGLYPENNGGISFEIYNIPGMEETEAVINCQGSAVLIEHRDNPVIDLQFLQAECNQREISGNEVYRRFKKIELDYGPGHQGIETIYIGREKVLAKLRLPSALANTAEQFVLHPSIMDGALQASIGMMESGTSDSITTPKLSLPFALQELEIYHRCTGSMWAVIQYNKEQTVTGNIRKLDIDLCDEQGQVCVRLKGYSSRMPEGNIPETVTTNNNIISSDLNQDQQAIVTATQDQLQENASNYLKKLLSPVIKLPVERMKSDTPLEKYGIDSIMAMELTNQLEKTFGSLSKTLFFEYQTIGELSGYFVKSYREQMNQLLGRTFKTEETEKTRTIPMAEPDLPVIRSRNKTRFTGLYPIRETKPNVPLEIAIIGVSGRYPQARNLNEFWQNLRGGKDCITEIPKERWDHSRYYDADKNKPGKTYSKWGGFIDGADQFDPLFFNISPREAELMDPQERLFLECVYETLEDAGYTRETLSNYQGLGLEGNTGVYVGVMYEEYQLYGAQAQVEGYPITLAGNPSSIANRVSYYCNFHGPSVAIDTMCSSSLTAIYLACQGIQRGSCELAIAGGVNVSIHPNKYLMLGQGKFVSSKGRCESFGLGGDGYVPGEGVGAVLLKPLSKAIADGDQIYGIIKGTAINHGGKTNGYTVPNPNAQAGVIGQAIWEAGIDPRTISYIEAHGTGTVLGDPIEITGLVKAFWKYTQEQQFCAIGSVKSNIGHCESAAGIAGVTKVLLQLKHRQIAPSLHSEKLNPNIDFFNTPFFVQQELTEWQRPVLTINGISNEYPRIAGISSFGAGGSNAHIIIEEYIPEHREQSLVNVTPQNPAMIILSAKNKERLAEQARQLLVAVQAEQYTDVDLGNMAYTLQVGREAMEERVAMLVDSIRELADKLKGYLAGRDDMIDFYQGQVKQNQDALAILTADEEMQETIQKWIERKKYRKLLELWVKGFIFDWQRVYGETRPRRISLPTYPFAKEKYWIPESNNKLTHPGIATSIHPLLHQNTSDLTEQRYSSVFTGLEIFLADHVVKGKKILPGVAYLEMARAAVEVAAGTLAEEQRMVKLKNVVWARPIEVDKEPVQVHIGLYLEENGEIAYEIYSLEENGGVETVVYGQGIAMLMETGKNPVIQLNAVQAECNQREISGTEVYDLFKTIGLEYGPGHQGLEIIYVGRGLALAKLSLPPSVAGTEDRFILHPSIMDGALQASIGMMVAENIHPPKLSLPFALEEIEIYQGCTKNMWAVLQSQGNMVDEPVRKLHIDICDEQGQVCVRMKGLTTRELGVGTGEIKLVPAIERIMLEKVWEDQAAGKIDENKSAAEYHQRLIILCEPGIISVENIEAELNGASCLNLQSKQRSIAKRYQTYAVQIFEALQKILIEKPTGKVLIQLVVTDREEEQVFTGLSGILKTAQAENPKMIVQTIEIGATENSEGLIAKLKENSYQVMDTQIRYHEGKRQVAKWTEMTVPSEITEIPWKEGGVYLITGGTGGLGMIFAKEIMERVNNVILILTGRSTLSQTKQAQMKGLEAKGNKVEYRIVDVNNRQAVKELIGNIVAEYGKLDGIIHSAGIIHDNYIIKKTKEEFTEVLASKVTGLENIDIACKEMKLDFMVLFSSIAGSIGNPGQADYAAANGFMDAYATYRNQMVNNGQRQGRTLSINWPLWREGGMKVEPAVEKMLRQATGMTTMQTTTGIKALYEGMAAGKSQMMVLEGDIRQIKMIFSIQTPIREHNRKKPEPMTGIASELLREKVSNYLKKLLEPVIKLPVERIEADTPLEKYGIDSIMVMELTNQLEKTFGSLPKTLFFEYQTIRELSGYFLDIHPEQLHQLIGIENQTETNGMTKTATMLGPAIQVSRHHKRFRFTGLQSIRENFSTKLLDIAIIGVSGRYPKARNLREFWQNLRDGKDCVAEIPKERWDYNQYFDEDKNKPGKTYSKWGGFIDGVDRFDPLFFNISPQEAEIMDPQERLFLECVYETMEDAGYTRETLSKYQESGLEGNVGIYVGVMYEEYQLYGAQAQVQGFPIALSGNPSSIANRVSYFCNFHGPSVALDTMCSSSLTAIHLACQSILRGGCEMAIAGGVNVSIHPNKYLMLGQGKFVSSKGRCESFGQGGDGYVPGEGVGAVLLKPLSKAISDGDHIYGVIKGTAINHGGKTNGYTVPNPNAQAGVIGQALREAGINPRTISYIEAHGTGTSLGDPIEISGLAKAFQKYTKDQQFCAIGSAKSNIGHCESAAGIAGITKVLLQLKNRQIVPSLHSKELNPNIDFRPTPFIVQQELTEWVRPVVTIDGVTKEYPRIAGISSFGAGGSNAHVVIEEYIPNTQEQSLTGSTSLNPAIIVLSAKDGERLKEQTQRLLSAIEEQQFTDADLTDIAYTLQVGREAMEERLGVLAGTMKELKDKLQDFIADRDSIEKLYYEYGKRNKDVLALFTMDEELQKTLQIWIDKQQYSKILVLWVKGLNFDWNRLYRGNRPRRISLPTYPFAGERYWISGDESILASNVGAENSGVTIPSGKTFIHPLLHQNTSDLLEQRYSSIFNGREVFFTDRSVNGQKVFSETICLEMVRAALEYAASGLVEGPAGIRINDIAWQQMIIANEAPFQVNVGIYPGQRTLLGGGDLPLSATEIGFEVYTLPRENDQFPANFLSGQDKTICSHGKAFLTPLADIPTLDLGAIRSQCTSGDFSAEELYQKLEKIGIYYGPAYQIIEKIYVEQGRALVKLSQPSPNMNIIRKLVLPPVIDSAIQAAIVFAMNAEGFKYSSSITIQELESFGNGTPVEWILIHNRQSNKTIAQPEDPQFDFDCCDEQGIVRLRLKGTVQTTVGSEPVSVGESSEKLLLQFHWNEQPIAVAAPTVEYIQRLVILCELGDLGSSPEEVLESIKIELNGAECLLLQSKLRGIDKRFQTYAIQVFEQLQRMFKAQPSGKVMVQMVLPGQGEKQLYSGLIGLINTARLENPQFFGQLIEMEVSEDLPGIIAKLVENQQSPRDIRIRYREGKRWVAGWDELKTTSEIETIPWKEGGVYLITGGAGGLGRIFAGEIVRQVKDVTLILTGRSVLSGQKSTQIKELEAKRCRVIYRQVDVSDRKAVADLIENILEEFGSLQGIIHSAGLIRDNYIVKKTPEEISEVLTPKVSGLVSLDWATRDLKLDFFILFSSISGIIGNPGQADYAAANAFMDTYAGYRNNLVALNRRQGRTLAINWPLWKEGGIGLDRESIQFMNQTSGLIPMSTQTGIQALYHGMNSGKDQIMVLEGDHQKLREMFLGKLSIRKSYVSGTGVNRRGRRPEMKGLNIEQCLEWELKGYINRLLKIPREKIDREKNLADLGFNSIGLTQLAIQITGHLGVEITPAVFFGYSTIEKLTHYLLQNHPETIHELYRETDGESTISSKITLPKPPETRQNRFLMNKSQYYQEPIAIIGMSGRFPGATNIDELWNILVTGQDMVKEIPDERFDWRQYYGDPDNEPGKTNCKWCGCIPDVKKFDPLFFEIAPSEAEQMDPRQRLLLEESWKALEDAGYGLEQTRNQKIGMFVGVEQGDYQLLTQGNEGIGSNNNAILAARLAYFLNLNGPVMAIDTACSSGLVAAHQGISSLRNGECDTMIIAGVNLLLTPTPFIIMSQSGMLSSDGKCFTFDKRANGMVPGEAVAVIVCKRLSRAEKDGDPIYAVIRGNGINYDGKTNGITAPNGVAQTELLKKIYDLYQINPEEIEYIVTHGTGTKLGDPVEINALYDAFKSYTKQQGYCALTSTKTNLGHTFAASGLVSLISLVQAIRHEIIPASLHCEHENDYINWQESPFYVNKQNKPWSGAKPRVGGVSAFGMSGTNAHMVVQSYYNIETGFHQEEPYYLLALSAKTRESLLEKAKDMIKVFESGARVDLLQVSYTLLKGRQHFNYRCAIVIQDREDAIHVLKQIEAKEKLPNLFQETVPWDFTGQKAIEEYAQELLNQCQSLKVNRNKYQEALFALADLYCQGYALEWNKLFGNRQLQRLHLPTYPFAGEEYWVNHGQPKNQLSLTTPQTASQPMQRNNHSFYNQLFDEVISGTTDTTAAVSKIKQRIANNR